MDTTVVDGNRNYNSEMEDEFDNYTNEKVCVDETVISGGFINEELYGTDNKQRSIHNYVTIKDESIDDQTVVAFINEKTCIEYRQGTIPNYVSMKDENIDDLTVVIPKTELITDYTDDKVCPNETIISRGYIKKELCGMKDEQGSIQNYISINDLIAVDEETELMIDCIDNKVCIYETIINREYIKEEPCDMENESGSIYNNVDMKGCKECGEEYDLYCLNCPMLNRIFDSNNPDGKVNTVRRTLPKNFIDICETPSCVNIVALRTIPKGVVFGPFRGLDSTKDDTVSKWKLKNKELAYTINPGWLNWMQYIRRVDKSSHKNLVPFQYEEELYYRSKCQINVGDELLLHWDSNSKKGEIQDMEDGYWKPQACERLDDTYACTFCCVGYKSISHLEAHNCTCIEKRNRKDFCEEIVQCDICKIYLDKKEYSGYHMDRCYKSNRKCVSDPSYRRNHGRPLRYRIHNGEKPFGCPLCLYNSKTKWKLRQHITIHNDDRPFACTFCPYKTRRNADLKEHIAIHNGDKPFACTLCPYKAGRKRDLKRHIAIHNDDKPFACPLCPYKARRKADLKPHVAAHKGDKPFACTICSYKATKKSTLKQHLTIHNDDKPFACTFCLYKAKTIILLKRHLVRHNE